MLPKLGGDPELCQNHVRIISQMLWPRKVNNQSISQTILQRYELQPTEYMRIRWLTFPIFSQFSRCPTHLEPINLFLPDQCSPWERDQGLSVQTSERWRLTYCALSQPLHRLKLRPSWNFQAVSFGSVGRGKWRCLPFAAYTIIPFRSMQWSLITAHFSQYTLD